MGFPEALVLALLCRASVAEVSEHISWPACVSGRICDDDFEPLGCFEQGFSTPWCHMVELPQKTKDIQPKFWLLTPDGRTQAINFFALSLSVAVLSDVDPSRELFVITHGFGDGWPRGGYVYTMAAQLNALGHNVIAVDWHKGSAMPNYFQAASNTRIMGAVVARVVEELASQRHLSPSKITLVGFSLGAHVSGFAGARIPGLKRIIALDPAGPLYASRDPFSMGMSAATRLNKTDAKLVQCIHTDGLSLANGGAGTLESFGHVDFYPNGGEIQPGCGPPVPVAINDLVHFDWEGVFDSLLCPHARSVWLFITSIVNAASPADCKFWAYPCASTADWLAGSCTTCPAGGCPIAGIETDYPTHFAGKYFFQTKMTNSTDSYLCGRQYILLMSFDTTVKGAVTVHFGGSGLISDPVKAVSSGRSLVRLVVVDLEESVQFIDLKYERDTNILDPGVEAFKTISIQLRELGNPTRGYRCFTTQTVTSGANTVIPLVSYKE